MVAETAYHATPGEKANVEGEALFQAVFDEAPDAMLLVDDDGRFVDANRSACSPFGAAPMHICGTRLDDYVPRLPGRSSVVGHEATDFDAFSVKRVDGTVREVEGGQVSSVGPGVRLLVLHDVTEQKSARRALRANEARGWALLDNIAEAVAFGAEDGTLHYISASIERILGFCAAGLMARNGFDWVDERDRRALVSTIATLVTDPSCVAQVDFRAAHRNGAIRWLHATVTNLLANEEVGAIVANIRDVTEERRAAAALRESEIRYREWVENSPEPMMVHVAHRIAFANATAARLLGVRDTAALIGRSILDFVHPDSYDEAKAVWSRCSSCGRLFRSRSSASCAKTTDRS